MAGSPFRIVEAIYPGMTQLDFTAPHTVFGRIPYTETIVASEAGGPIDHASYTCQCGCVFSASVSTTVACPHCGVAQAW